jgi:hypothetical protein
MGRRIPTPQESDGASQSVDPGPGARPCPATPPPEGPTLSRGPLLARTVRPFFPELDAWIDAIDEPRFQPQVVYDQPFLLGWGLALFLCQLGSRRQRDYPLNNDGPAVLANLNRRAGRRQQTRPVNKTLEYLVGRIGNAALGQLRQQLVQRLIRLKALAAARLQGRFLVLIDGSGYLVFNHPHGPPCLTQTHGATTVYRHQVLEAKRLGPAGTVFSRATAFIDNRDAQEPPADARPEPFKQDGALKALPRLLATSRAAFPPLRICLVGDSLFACGPGLQVARDHHCDYLYVFKPGRTPALWRDFQGLRRRCPKQRVEWTTPQQRQQVYRWVNDRDYEASEGRRWSWQAVQGRERTKEGEATAWAWVTSLAVDRKRVVDVAMRGGRQRWREENEGFNTQKNRGLNLEHAYSHRCWAA